MNDLMINVVQLKLQPDKVLADALLEEDNDLAQLIEQQRHTNSNISGNKDGDSDMDTDMEPLHTSHSASSRLNSHILYIKEGNQVQGISKACH